jgi:hypothetical protein
MARMPTLWWLRPVSNAARVGEHERRHVKVRVAKSRLGQLVDARSGQVGAKAVEVRVTQVVNE